MYGERDLCGDSSRYQPLVTPSAAQAIPFVDFANVSWSFVDYFAFTSDDCRGEGRLSGRMVRCVENGEGAAARRGRQRARHERQWDNDLVSGDAWDGKTAFQLRNISL